MSKQSSIGQEITTIREISDRSNAFEGSASLSRILGVNSTFECVTSAGDLRLSERNGISSGDLELPLYQIDSSDRLTTAQISPTLD